MTRLTHDHLLAIERHADFAPVQQLRLQVMQIRDELQHLVADEADYARALLMKLGRIVDEQLTPRVSTQPPPTWFGDWQPPTWLTQPIQATAAVLATPRSTPATRSRIGRRRPKTGPTLPQRAAGAGTA
jgi:hypothetical protein